MAASTIPDEARLVPDAWRAKQAIAGRVLVIAVDDSGRHAEKRLLEDAGYAVSVADSGEEGLSRLQRTPYDVVLLEVRLPRLSGLGVLKAAAELELRVPFVVATAFGSVETAVTAMKAGAFDYLARPFPADRLLATVDRAAREARSRGDYPCADRSGTASPIPQMVGRSAAMTRMYDLIARVAPMRATVLVNGETGTGKELVARSIHELSARASHPFVAINCSALPETLLASELFGHVKGSFTGAVSSKRGLLEEADGGTLFLDELSTISPHIQVTLLRVLEEHVIHPVGAVRPVSVDFRLIAATNEDLHAKVEAGEFREDLFYRLNVFPITVPPLRERQGDIALLAEHFRVRFAQQNGLMPPAISAPTLKRMEAHDWPGNVRELENFVERALILYAGSREIRFDVAEPLLERQLVWRASREGWSLARLEREYILATLEKTAGHRGRASAILGIDRRTMYRKMKSLGLIPSTPPVTPSR